jgi:hypothetical protein
LIKIKFLNLLATFSEVEGQYLLRSFSYLISVLLLQRQNKRVTLEGNICPQKIPRLAKFARPRSKGEARYGVQEEKRWSR